MKKMHDSIEFGPWCFDQYITFQEFLPYTGLLSHYPMKFDGWKDTFVESFASEPLFPT